MGSYRYSSLPVVVSNHGCQKARYAAVFIVMESHDSSGAIHTNRHTHGVQYSVRTSYHILLIENTRAGLHKSCNKSVEDETRKIRRNGTSDIN